MRGHNEDIYCQVLPLNVFGKSENDVVAVKKQTCWSVYYGKLTIGTHSNLPEYCCAASPTSFSFTLTMRLDLTSAKP